MRMLPAPPTLLLLGLALFAFWLVLSGERDWFHLALGAGAATWIALGTRRLLSLDPPIVTRRLRWREGWRLAAYVPWLVWQIVVGSFEVAWVVLHPRLPISPRLVRLHVPLPHNLARLVLANSITLTPGTVTLDVDGDEFVVHALTASSAAALGSAESPGDMIRRVSAIFDRED